jgi:Tfp pilus assembly protein PilF
MKRITSRQFKQKFKLITQGLLLAGTVSLFGCATTPSAKTDAAVADPDSALIQEGMASGDEAVRNNNMELALFHYVKVLSLNPDLIEALYKIATIHSALGNTELAEKAYRDILKQEKNHAGTLEGLGLLQLRQKKYDPAKQNFAAAIKADPKRWRSYNGLGVIADLEKDYTGAQKYYQAALQTTPDSSMLLNNLGYSYYLAGNWPSAQQFFEKALVKNSLYEKAWANLGLLYVRQNNYDKAASSFDHIMDKAKSLYYIGYILMMEGNYAAASEYFHKAISASPTYYADANKNLERIQRLLRAS